MGFWWIGVLLVLVAIENCIFVKLNKLLNFPCKLTNKLLIEQMQHMNLLFIKLKDKMQIKSSVYIKRLNQNGSHPVHKIKMGILCQNFLEHHCLYMSRSITLLAVSCIQLCWLRCDVKEKLSHSVFIFLPDGGKLTSVFTRCFFILPPPKK